VAATVALLLGLTIPAAQAGPGTSLLGNSTAPYARQSNFVRPARSTEQVRLQVYLRWRNAAGAEAAAYAAATPGTAGYRRFMTPAAWRSRFSATTATVRRVREWLRSSGLHVGAVPANRLFVPATGSVRTAERTFGVSLGYYRVHGQVLRAPSGAPRIPSQLSSVVLGIGGLAQSRAHHDAPPPPGFRVGHPCSGYWGERFAMNKPPAYGGAQPYAPCGYRPAQLQGAYGISDLISNGTDGSGVTVAIIDAFAAPTIVSDVQTYSSRHGLPAPSITQMNAGPPYHGSTADQEGWYGEETLDLEAVHSMAPAAAMLFEGGKSDLDPDLLDRLNDIVANDRASIVTNSYGELGEALPKAIILAQHQVFEEAASTGISVLFSSGDSGDEVDTIGYRSADWPASDPLATAVGGTSLGVGPLDNYLFETGWGSTSSDLNGNTWTPKPPGDWVYGGGGGASRIFDEPDYQVGVVPSSMSGYFGGAARVVPDVAAVGDPNTGFLEGETQRFPGHKVKYDEYRIGGTSLSSPLMAGIVALAVQTSGSDLGLINPTLYSLAGSDAFHDVVNPRHRLAVVRANLNNGVDNSAGTSFVLRSLNQTESIHTVKGYDDVTGVGTPNGADFVNDLANGTP
jgi:subtilase family serine protease